MSGEPKQSIIAAKRLSLRTLKGDVHAEIA